MADVQIGHSEYTYIEREGVAVGEDEQRPRDAIALQGWWARVSLVNLGRELSDGKQNGHQAGDGQALVEFE